MEWVETWLELLRLAWMGAALTGIVIGLHGCTFLITGLEKWYWQMIMQIGVFIVASGPICISAWKLMTGEY